MLAFIISGFLVGFAVGATGVGGGALMTPLLILGFGISPAVAVGTDLLFAAGTKGFGTILHGAVGTVKWRIVLLLASGSIPASIATIMVLDHVGIDEEVERIMLLMLAGAIVFTASGVSLKAAIQKYSSADSWGWLKAVHARLQTPLTVLGGIALGILVTMSSVGAGVIGATLLLLLYPRIRAIEIVGTDLAHAVPLTLVAGLGHFHLGTTDWSILGYLMIGSLPGIYLGTRLGFRLPDKVLRPLLAAVLVVIGISLIIRA